MPMVDLMIAGRSYKVACRDGEEENLRAAARLVDGKSREALSGLGTLSEASQFMFASLLLADQLLDKNPAAVPPSPPSIDPALAARAEALAARLESLADTLEREAANPQVEGRRALPGARLRKIPEAIEHPRELSLP
jgi:cell division protein ZapA